MSASWSSGIRSSAKVDKAGNATDGSRGLRSITVYIKNETNVIRIGTALHMVAARDQSMYRLRRAFNSACRLPLTLAAKRRSHAKYLMIRMFCKTSLVEWILASVAAMMVFCVREKDLAMYKFNGNSSPIIAMPTKELKPKILYSRAIAITIWTGVAAHRKCK